MPRHCDGAGLLVDLASNPEEASLSRMWADRVNYVSAKAKDALGLATFLVRPDGFIAWAADENTQLDLPALKKTLSRWFGDTLG